MLFIGAAIPRRCPDDPPRAGCGWSSRSACSWPGRCRRSPRRSCGGGSSTRSTASSTPALAVTGTRLDGSLVADRPRSLLLRRRDRRRGERIPFVAFSVYAALGQVPGDVVEAASLDGARGLKRFRFVVFPYLRIVLVVSWCCRSSGICGCSHRSTRCSRSAASLRHQHPRRVHVSQASGDFGATVRSASSWPSCSSALRRLRALDSEGRRGVSTQINAGTQLGTIGVEEVLGEPDASRRLGRGARGSPIRLAGSWADGPQHRRARRLRLLGVPRLLDGEHVAPPGVRSSDRSPILVPVEFTLRKLVPRATREAVLGDRSGGLLTAMLVTLGVRSPLSCSPSSPPWRSRAIASGAGGASSSPCSSSR